MSYGNYTGGVGSRMATSRLPFSCTQLEFPFLSYLDDDHPPFVPDLAFPVADLDPFLPYLTARVCIEAHERAEQNELTVLFFNRCAENDWQNRFFVNLVESAAVYLSMLAELDQLTNNPSIDFPKAAGVVVQLSTTNQVKDFPELEDFIPREADQVIRQQLQDYAALKQELQNYRNHLARSGGGQRDYSGGGQAAMRGRHAWGRAQNTGTQSAAGDRFRRNRQEAPRSVNPSFVRQERSQPQGARPQTTNETGSSRRYSQAMNNNQQPPAQENPVMEQSADVVEPQTMLVPKGYRWRPTNKQRTYPAYRPSQQALLVEKTADGDILKIETNMDYKVHNLPNCFGGVKEFQTARPVEVTQELINDGVRSIMVEQEATGKGNDTLEDIGGEEPGPFHPLVNTSAIFSSSSKIAWQVAGLRRSQLIREDGTLPPVYMSYVAIVEGAVSAKDETDYVAELSKCETFIELRKKIVAFRDVLNPELISIINRRMTSAINRTIRTSLSIPRLKIGSFVDDITEVLSVINDSYGALALKLMHESAKPLIASVLCAFENHTKILDDEREDLYARIGNGLNRETSKITFVGSFQSMTLVDVLANELDVELTSQVASELSSEFTPVLYKLVKTIFEITEASETPCERNLLRTSDGVILEATRGAFSNESFQLSIVG